MSSTSSLNSSMAAFVSSLWSFCWTCLRKSFTSSRSSGAISTGSMVFACAIGAWRRTSKSRRPTSTAARAAAAASDRAASAMGTASARPGDRGDGHRVFDGRVHERRAAARLGERERAGEAVVQGVKAVERARPGPLGQAPAPTRRRRRQPPRAPPGPSTARAARSASRPTLRSGDVRDRDDQGRTERPRTHTKRAIEADALLRATREPTNLLDPVLLAGHSAVMAGAERALTFCGRPRFEESFVRLDGSCDSARLRGETSLAKRRPRARAPRRLRPPARAHSSRFRGLAGRRGACRLGSAGGRR